VNSIGPTLFSPIANTFQAPYPLSDECVLERGSSDNIQDEPAQGAQLTLFSSRTNPRDHLSQFFKLRPLDLFWWFVGERQAIWRKRFLERQSPPWTLDPILRTYRFTNVYRELDPGTKFAIENILERPFPAKDRIFNVMLYRLIGRSDTFVHIGFQKLSDFRQHDFESKLKNIRRSPVRTWLPHILRWALAIKLKT